MIFISSPGCPGAVIKAAESELVLRTSAKNQKPRDTAERQGGTEGLEEHYDAGNGAGRLLHVSGPC